MNFSKSNLDDFIRIFNLNNINALFRLENHNYWLKVFNEIEFKSFFYSLSFLNYSSEYEKSINFKFFDLSIILFESKEPIAISPIFLIKEKKNSDYFIQIKSPIFINKFYEKKKYQKNFFERFNKSLLEFKNKFNIKKINIKFVFINKNTINNWLFEYLKKNKKYVLSYEYYLDLTNKNFNLDQAIRSSTLSQIKKTDKKFKISLLSKKNKNKWNDFKKLHFDVSKRQTRSDESWKIQLSNIDSNNSLLFFVENSNDFVSGCYFDITKDEANYSVSVSNDFAKKNNLNSLLLYKSIDYLLGLNIKYVRLGYNNFSNKNSKKIDQINFFKENFYNSIFLSFIIDL
jgi:hypothetical protein